MEGGDAIVWHRRGHSAPCGASEGLRAGAARCLPRGGVLDHYGPYRRGGGHTAPSNAAFDESLRARNPAWGLRDVEAVAELAQAQGLTLGETVEMPANNLSLILTRT